MAVHSFEEMAQRELANAFFDGTLRRFGCRLTRKSDQLLAFSDNADRMNLKGRRDMGLQVVSINHIVGSLGRCRDFDRSFYPCRLRQPERWKRIALAHYQGIDLPPVELYKVGAAYYVVDGHHRISVARVRGQQFIDAHVTEFDVV